MCFNTPFWVMEKPLEMIVRVWIGLFHVQRDMEAEAEQTWTAYT